MEHFAKAKIKTRLKEKGTKRLGLFRNFKMKRKGRGTQ